MRSSRRPARIAILGVTLAAAACGGGQGAPAASTVTAKAPAAELLPVPPESTLKADPVSLSVLRGRALVNATKDSLPGYVGNDLRCTSCHLFGGRRAGAMAWVGVYGRFPQYRSRSAKVTILEDRINDCFQRSMSGKPLDIRGDDMRDIVAYMAWLSRGVPVGARTPGQGLDSIAQPAFDASKGQALYTEKCARCHGPAGEGLKGLPPMGHDSVRSAPPLWGPHSFNLGAGMARLRAFAAFAGRQMPIDAPGTLSPEETYAIAAYVIAQPRPDFATKHLDWPKGGTPPDVAYKTDFEAAKKK